MKESMSQHYYFQISNTPATLVRMIDGIRPDQYDTALSAERFTLRELVAHLADWEQIFLDRITQAVEYPGSTIEAIDEGQRAIDHHYSEKDVHHELEVFENRRRDTVSYLLGLAEDDWTKTAIHSERGEVTVEQLVHFLLGHDMYHIHQVSEYLK